MLSESDLTLLEQKANNKQLSLYHSTELGERIDALCIERQLVRKKMLLSALIGEIILGAHSQSQLPELLIERLQLPHTDAVRITADVLDFLAPLNAEQGSTAPDQTAAPQPTINHQPLTPAAAPTPEISAPAPTPSVPLMPGESVSVPPAPTKTPVDIATMKAQLDDAEANLPFQPVGMQPLHTMAGDMQAVEAAQTSATTPLDPNELIRQHTPEGSILADGPGQQIKNPTATWGSDT